MQLDEVTYGLVRRRKGDRQGDSGEQAKFKRNRELRRGQESGQRARGESSDGGKGVRTDRHR